MLLVKQISNANVLLINLIGKIPHLHVSITDLALQVMHQRLHLCSLSIDLNIFILKLFILELHLSHRSLRVLHLLLIFKYSLLLLPEYFIVSIHSILKELVLCNQVINLMRVVYICIHCSESLDFKFLFLISYLTH